MPTELRSALEAFGRARTSVEEAKATLLLGIPSGRGARLPLAEALSGFELLLREAADGMPAWSRPEVMVEWRSCGQALEEAGRRAERLRLEPPPPGYEELAPALGELLEPLGAFDVAADRFREVGV